MGENSKIEWTHHTFNPWRGCTKIADGCANCYAERFSKQNPAVLGEWGPNGKRVLAAESYWRQPLKWNKEAEKAGQRRRVFCGSMMDIFEEPPAYEADGVTPRPMWNTQGKRLATRVGRETAAQWPDEAGWRPLTMIDTRERLFELIDRTPHLDWLLLTKRPENIERLTPWRSNGCSEVSSAFAAWQFRSNMWLGYSAATQEDLDRGVPHLLKCPAAVRFLSLEPLLGPLSLARWVPRERYYLARCERCGLIQSSEFFDECRYQDDADVVCPNCRGGAIDDHPKSGIDWVIVGGESGPGARPMHPEWVRSLRDQCQEAGVPFFMKQMAKREPIPEDLQIREYPHA